MQYNLKMEQPRGSSSELPPSDVTYAEIDPSHGSDSVSSSVRYLFPSFWQFMQLNIPTKQNFSSSTAISFTFSSSTMVHCNDITLVKLQYCEILGDDEDEPCVMVSNIIQQAMINT